MSSTDPRPLSPGQAQAPIPIRPSPPPERPASLPLPLTSFVGRDHEIAAVAALACRAGVRLVTLTGPGGVGKTRLAIRVAEQIAPDYPDGVWFVPLAAVPSAELVAASVAQVLDVELTGDDPIEREIARHIGGKRALMILDNLEHLLDCGAFVVGLLGACPRLTVLATSRAVLRVSGEHVVNVSPLATPDPGPLPTSSDLPDATRLFAERAAAADAAFTLTDANAPAVAEICRRLDGLPLALELAAARISAFSPELLLRRLGTLLPLLTQGPRDAPPRMQAMDNAIGWSYGLLTAEHQALFRGLAVFVGGFTLDAAEAIGQPTDISFPGGITALVDQSLVYRGQGPNGEARFGMLETIREYGLVQLTAAGEDAAVRNAHAAYFVALAQRGGAALRGSSEEQALWWHRLDAEIGNFRAALAWLRDNDQIEDALRLAGGLDWFWSAGAYLEEGQRWVDLLIGRSTDDIAPEIRAQALGVAAMIANHRGDRQSARALAERSLPLWRLAGREVAVAEALLQLASTAIYDGRYEDARPLVHEATELARRCNAPWAEATALHLTGRLAMSAGEPGRALADLRQAAELFREADDPVRELSSRCDEGVALLTVGERRAAQGVFAHVLETDLAIDEDRALVPHALLGIAALIADNEPPLAARLIGAATAHLARVARVPPIQTLATYDTLTASGRARLGEAGWQAAWTAGRTLAIEEAANEGRLALRRLTGAIEPSLSVGDAAADLGLTRRELEVLRLVTDGLTDREIADRLFIARRTASKHVEAILAKLDVSSRRAAAVEARRRGLTWRP